MKAYIMLENGQVFEGESTYDFPDTVSEIVFNTSMVGYLEILTDPSYAGQSIVMTYPLIGNYGITLEDVESKNVWASAFITHEFARKGSNFRSTNNILNFMESKKIPAIYGIDTRMLTKILRQSGTMMGLITTKEYSKEEADKLIKEYVCPNLVLEVTSQEKEECGEGDVRIALMDFGCKSNILRSLLNRNCRVTVFPGNTNADEILSQNFDGIVLSNGPGDPKECKEIIENVKKIYNSNIPVFAVCLGHQLMALANGIDTHKLKYGHRGANHPVKELSTGRVYITSQNHGYVVDDDVPVQIAKVSYINVNDGTVEGLEYVGKNIKTVQFHPEACPGPQDTNYLFDEFIQSLK